MTSPEIDTVGSMDGPLVGDTLPAYSLARWRIKNNFRGNARFRRINASRRGSEWNSAIKTTLCVDNGASLVVLRLGKPACLEKYVLWLPNLGSNHTVSLPIYLRSIGISLNFDCTTASPFLQNIRPPGPPISPT